MQKGRCEYMRADRDLLMFVNHKEWYFIDENDDYVAKEEAPEEIKEAIKRYRETRRRLTEEKNRGIFK